MHVTECAPASQLVYQIDIINVCNAQCSYCPYSTMQRAPQRMTKDVFAATLRCMSNREVSLHHFGEPLLHPDLEEFVGMAVGMGFRVGFSTNGKRLTQARLDQLGRVGLAWLRIHTDPFGVRLAQFKTPLGMAMTEHRLMVKNDAPKKDLVSFSGYLDMPTKVRRACSFLTDGWRVVLSNGTFALCCHDMEGTNAKEVLCSECEGYVFRSPSDWGHYDGQ